MEGSYPRGEGEILEGRIEGGLNLVGSAICAAHRPIG